MPRYSFCGGRHRSLALNTERSDIPVCFDNVKMATENSILLHLPA